MSSSGEEETEHTPSPSPPPPPPEIMSLDFDIPSPKTYLAKLKASLEKNTRHTNSKSRNQKLLRHHSSRKRHLTSPLSIKGPRVPSRNGRRLSEYQGGSAAADDDDGLSQSSDSPSSSSESITLTTVDIGRSKRATSSSSPMHSHFSPVIKGILGGAAGRVTAWDQPTIHRSTNNGGNTSLSTSLLPNHHHMHNGASSVVSGGEKSDIMSSLQMINGQLGELLCRLGPSQTLTSPAAVTTAPLALPSYSRYSPSPVSSFLVGDIGAASLHQYNSTLLNTSGK